MADYDSNSDLRHPILGGHNSRSLWMGEALASNADPLGSEDAPDFRCSGATQPPAARHWKHRRKPSDFRRQHVVMRQGESLAAMHGQDVVRLDRIA